MVGSRDVVVWVFVREIRRNQNLFFFFYIRKYQKISEIFVVKMERLRTKEALEWCIWSKRKKKKDSKSFLIVLLMWIFEFALVFEYFIHFWMNFVRFCTVVSGTFWCMLICIMPILHKKWGRNIFNSICRSSMMYIVYFTDDNNVFMHEMKLVV